MFKKNTKLHKVRTVRNLLQIFLIIAIALSLVGLQPPRIVKADTCVTSRISAGADDVEERNDTGAVDLDGDSSTNALQTFRGYQGSSTGTLNWWGLRFLNINVPQGSSIVSAKITFRANASSGTTASGMTLWGQLAANPATFSNTTNNVTNRTRTTTSVAWAIPQWTSGSNYMTPDLAAIVQEIVDQAGWVENNALVIIGQTTVSQNRSAASRDSTNGSTLAPLLEVCYTEATSPRITISGSLSSFSGEPGVPSAAQSYSVEGTNLEGGITITPPADFQIMKTGDTDWVSNPNTLVLPASGGTVASTEILVRFLRPEVGTSSGSILHTSLNAVDRILAVTGTAKVPLGAWIAYNDCAWASGQLETNITKYTITSGSTTGLLVDYDTGNQTPVTATVTSSGSPNVLTGEYGGSETAAGTDAYKAFHGIVDMPGAIQYGSSGWSVTITFTGLSPDKTYAFVTSANRDGNYTDRLTKFTLQDAESAVNTSSTGVSRSTTTINEDTSVFNTGNNTNEGYVASWASIVPGSDGDFSVRAEANTGTNAYAFSVFSLAEELAVTDPTIYVAASLSNFTTKPDVASAPQTYTVSAVNLTENLLISAPTGFELSTDGSTFQSALNLIPVDGSISSRTIYVRLFSTTQGNFGGNITHTSSGATPKTLAIEGTVANQVCYTDQEFVTSADTYISGYNTSYNYGKQTYISVSLGSSQARGGLVRWNLDSLPVGAIISNPRLQLNVSTAGSATFNLYNLRRDWVEGSGSGSATGDGATWGTFDGTNTWGSNGAANTSSDRFDTNLWGAGSSSFSSTGIKTVALNSSGLAVVQGWADGLIPNYGLTIQNYTGSSSTNVQFSSKDHGTAANRPRLILDYCVGDVETYSLAITAAPSGSGSVTLMPSGGTYIVDSVVTMTPVPATGYKFDSWGGADVGDIIDTAGVYTIVMDADKAITANFSLLPVPHAPDAPTLVAPADEATNVSLPPQLSVSVTDPDNDSMNVSFYGRPVSETAPAEDFLFIAIPDTQNNAQSSNTVLQDQFAWIANRYTNPGEGNPDLVFVTHLGDLVNTSSQTIQWQNIDAAFDKLDVAGVPYSVGPGNHDIAFGTTYYTDYFGSARFTGKPWYQGYYASGSDNYNNYSLFSAGGMDFIMINLQYNAGSGALDWADALLKANPNRRGIVEQHDILNVDNSWVNQASYTALSDNPNLFLMLCGHMHSGSDGSAYRHETRSGMQPVHIVQTDYQELTGQDFIRLLTFKPTSDQIYAQTFSPVTPGGYKTSESNYEQFTMAYDMDGVVGAPFELIGTASDIPSGSNATINWADRAADTEYEWYAIASDGSLSTTSSTWSFTTAGVAENQPPVVSGIPDQTISEGASFLTIDLDDYVADPDNTDAEMIWTYSGNTALTVSIDTRVATIGIPNLDWNGSETITFRATDPGSLFDEDSANFTVTAVNDAPVVSGIPDQTISEGATFTTIALDDYVADPDNADSEMVWTFSGNMALTVSIVNRVATIGIPNLDWNGNETITFRATDPGGLFDADSANFTVTAVNDTPIAQDQTVTTAEDTAKEISLVATDADGDTLTYTVVDVPTNGTLSGTAPNLTYTPNADFNGTDTFTFKANDGTIDSNTATVTITITSVNDKPVAQDQSVASAEDTAKDITLVATDADGESLIYTVVNGPTNGTLSGTAPNLTYTPNANFHGTDSFTFKANDGTIDSNTATVTITVTAVNDAPVAEAQSATTLEDTAIEITLVATDADGDTLTYTVVDVPTNGTLSGTAPNLTYTPNANFVGTDSFTFKANDSTVDSNTATVTITVTAVNDAPVLVTISNATIPEMVAYTFTAIAADVDSVNLTFSLVGAPAGASMTEAGVFSWTPSEAQGPGVYTFTVKVCDDASPALCAEQEVTLTVTEVNRLPVLTEIGDKSVVATNEVKFTATATDPDLPTNSLSFSLVGAPAGATIDATSGEFSWMPTDLQVGEHDFEVCVNDGTVTVCEEIPITVTARNFAPVAVDDPYSTAFNTTLTVPAPGVLGNDNDPEGAALTAIKLSDPASGTLTFNSNGSFTYAPALGFSGTVSFTYKANDGDLDSLPATVTITVGANTAPVAQAQDVTTDEDTAIEITLAATDVDGQSLTYSIVGLPAHGTLGVLSGNTVTYTPALNYFGDDSFTFKANDGYADSLPATVSITVTPVNDAPLAQDQTVTTDEDTAIAIYLVATDVDNTTLTYSIVAQPTHGSLNTLSGNPLIYTPSKDYHGTDSFTFIASDGLADSEPATVTITVTPVNDAPIAQNQTVTTLEDTAKEITLVATDVDDDSLTYSIVVEPTHGSLSIVSGNTVTYTPAPNYFGDDSFTFKGNDSTVDSNIATVAISVTAVNDVPVAQDQSVETDEDLAKEINLIATDIDLDALTYEIVDEPEHGSLSEIEGDKVTYTPNANYNGPDSFTFKVNDGTTDSNEATVSITVTAVNDAPVAVDDSYTTPFNTTLIVPAPGVLLNDIDPEDDDLTANKLNDPDLTSGTLTFNANGSFTYVPALGFSGTVSFTYKANDDDLDSLPATVTITVGANTAPVAQAQDVTTDEDTAIEITLGATDVDGQSLTYSIVGQPAHGTLSVLSGNKVTYTPALNYFGSDSFTFKANDGYADSISATVSITVTAVNDVPLAEDQSVTTLEDTAKAITLVATDVDGDPLTYTVVAGPTNGTLSGTAPNLTYTPNANFYGSDSFTFKANDGGTVDSNIATVSITVTAVNDAPVAEDQSVTTLEDTAKEIALVATDADGDPLTYTIVTDPMKGTLSGTAPNLTYTPNANYNGPDSFTFKASDGFADSELATVTITVTAVNDVPVAQDQTVETDEDLAKEIALVATDIDLDTLTYEVVVGPAIRLRGG